jgi:long-subunit acyl-CoA synthetase (AMP-forming)
MIVKLFGLQVAQNWLPLMTPHRSFGHCLQNLGAKKNDVLAIFMPNNVEWPIVWFGTTFVGVIGAPINPDYNELDLRRLLELSQATWAVTTPEQLPVLKAAVNGLSGSQREAFTDDRIFVVGGRRFGYCKSTKN